MVSLGCIQGNPENAGTEFQNVTDWGGGFLAWRVQKLLMHRVAVG
jgi:hypothetical protein